MLAIKHTNQCDGKAEDGVVYANCYREDVADEVDESDVKEKIEKGG